jgi:hypothetical protein
MTLKQHIIEHLQTRYPVQVAGLLNHYKVGNIEQGAQTYGEQFVNDLYRISIGQMSNNDGAQDKGQWMQVLQAAFGLGNMLLNNKKDKEPPKPDNTLLWVVGGSVLLMVLVVIIILISRK